LKGLKENQLKWKPTDSTWSVADCVEHIALSEKNIFDWAMGTLKEPANPANRRHD
jgi:DinB superfamily